MGDSVTIPQVKNDIIPMEVGQMLDDYRFDESGKRIGNASQHNYFRLKYHGTPRKRLTSVNVVFFRKKNADRRDIHRVLRDINLGPEQIKLLDRAGARTFTCDCVNKAWKKALCARILQSHSHECRTYPMVSDRVKVTVGSLEDEITDAEVLAYLGEYGDFSHNTEDIIYLRDSDGYYNAERVYTCNDLITDIPSFTIMYGKQVSIRYKDQPMTCRLCDSREHRAADCPLNLQRNSNRNTRAVTSNSTMAITSSGISNVAGASSEPLLTTAGSTSSPISSINEPSGITSQTNDAVIQANRSGLAKTSTVTTNFFDVSASLVSTSASQGTSGSGVNGPSISSTIEMKNSQMHSRNGRVNAAWAVKNPLITVHKLKKVHIINERKKSSPYFSRRMTSFGDTVQDEQPSPSFDVEFYHEINDFPVLTPKTGTFKNPLDRTRHLGVTKIPQSMKDRNKRRLKNKQRDSLANDTASCPESDSSSNEDMITDKRIPDTVEEALADMVKVPADVDTGVSVAENNPVSTPVTEAASQSSNSQVQTSVSDRKLVTEEVLPTTSTNNTELRGTSEPIAPEVSTELRGTSEPIVPKVSKSDLEERVNFDIALLTNCSSKAAKPTGTNIHDNVFQELLADCIGKVNKINGNGPDPATSNPMRKRDRPSDSSSADESAKEKRLDNKDSSVGDESSVFITPPNKGVSENFNTNVDSVD